MGKQKQNIQKWKEWININGHTPTRHSKDTEEARLAARISRMYNYMKKNPVKYKELIQDYEDTYRKYNSRNIVCKDFCERFKQWKIWVYENQKIPKTTSSIKEERCIANNFNNALKKIQKTPSDYSHYIEEYNEICESITEYNRIQKYIGVIAQWKEWTNKHKHLPRQSSSNIVEKKIAKKMTNLAVVLRQDSMYKELLEEYVEFYNTQKKLEKAKPN